MPNNCPVCHSADVKNTVRASRDGFDIALIECNYCGHFAQPQENYEEIYSTGEFTTQARGQSNTPSPQKIKDLDKRALNRFDYYEKYLNELDDILEVGSSIGSFVHVLKLNGKNASGLEPDESYANYSRQQYGFDQQSGLLEDVTFPQKFGGVCSFHVLEHVSDPHVFIKKCHDLLMPCGKLLFELPSLELHMYGSMTNTIWQPHVHYFTQASLYHLLSQYFEIKHIGFYGSALFVYAEKSDSSTFKSSTFKGLKRKAKLTSTFIKVFPSIKFSISKITIKQLFLQSFIFQHNKKKLLAKGLKLGWFAFKNIRYLRKEKGSGTTATHISYYSGWENAGDTVLSKCVRDNFQTVQKTKWQLQKVTHKVSQKSIDQINRGQYLAIGGGGLLLPDSNPNSISGWQWAIDQNQLKAIEVPIIVYAIGYNFFHGQEPTPLFIENVKAMVNQADFFSLRNHGSINQLIKLIGEEEADKIHYQPCPTTLIRKFTPGIPAKVRSKNVAVNMAFDRYHLRFGSDIYTILDQVALALKQIENQGYKIFNVCHLTNDKTFELVLNKHQVGYQSIDLQYTVPSETYDFYNNMELVMGSRGHAQMIPFGLNAKIISLGTHNKLRWFLEDIDCPEWHIDLRNEPVMLAQKIVSVFDDIMGSNHSDDKIAAKQDYLYGVTKENLDRIAKMIN